MKSLKLDRTFNRASIILLCVIAIAAAASTIWAADRWDHYSDGTYEYWDLDGNSKFRWKIQGGQWWHFSTYGLWKTLSTPGLSSDFIGNGSWYDMGYGLKYRYDLNSDNGFFGLSSSYRFYYGYGPGQWRTSGCGGGWYNIGTAGMSAGVLGNGDLYDLGNGMTFRYSAAQDYGFYSRAGHYRFYYRYTPGQWYTSGYGGGWYSIGAAGICAGVLADGDVHSLGNGLAFRYDAGNDYGFYSRGMNYRFYYRYTPGQWYTSGYGGGWRTIGTASTCAWVLADGNLHDLGNGLKFQYTAGDDYGFYYLGADALDRFYYAYTPGQWYTSGYGGGWYELSDAGLPAWGFFDGTARDLGNGFEFRYDQVLDCGYFTRDEVDRFYYVYAPGQWSHRGNSSEWAALTDANWSAAFIGNGAGYDLGNGFSYNYADDSGVFRHGNNDRFTYRYGPSQWYHAGNATDMAALTAGGYSAEFIGDGGWYDLGNGFTYSYASDQHGYFKVGDFERFSYHYEPGQWSHRGDTTDWAALTANNYSTAFIGDGHTHYVGNGVSYYYSHGNGWFKIGGHERFWYEYGPSQWSHCRADGPWVDLSAEHISAQFIGDGDWHALGTGWDYQHAFAGDYGWFKQGDAHRFMYRYGPGQWYHKGDATEWVALTSSNYSLTFIADGAEHGLGNGWSYTYTGTSGTFKAGGHDRFSYAYGNSQWSHKGDTSEWGTLSAEGMSAQFVGDGAWRNIGYGLTYQYQSADDEGHFKVGTTERFYYTYGPSQWFHKGDSTWWSWVALTAENHSTEFIGNGEWQDLGNGWSYQYVANDDEGHFKTDTAERFSYRYGPSQWFHKGDATGWYGLTAEQYSAAFIGDGADHILDDSWSYSYSTGSDYGHYKLSSGDRFSYAYGPSQWYHKANTTDWAALTSENYSLGFMGDGGWHDLGNGFSYKYSIQQDDGTFGLSDDPDDAERFLYFYNGGQWYHMGDSTMPAALTGDNYSAAFIGDGDWYELGDGWTYSYDIGDDKGYFKEGTTERFLYSYTPSQWSHKGDTTAWGTLSATNVWAQFVGDGNWYDLGNGFTYQYVTGDREGYFKAGANERFYFTYGTAQWSHKGNGTDWVALTAANFAADFVGDGADHNIGNGWTYSYLKSNDYGAFIDWDGFAEFAFSYAPGQWFHKGQQTTASWAALTAGGYSIDFIGDGEWHSLGTGWSYQYSRGAGYGAFKTSVGERFAYDYEVLRWLHKGDWQGGWGWLSADGASAVFVGDGGWYDLGTGFTFQYVTADDKGYFKDGTDQRFYYGYAQSQWSHKGHTTDWAALTTGNHAPDFVGDGHVHDLGNGISYYYTAGSANGWFKVNGHEQFWYEYIPGQWYHHGAATEWVALTAADYSAQFVGDGAEHDLGEGWIYSFVASSNYGQFKTGGNARFSYWYGPGQWYHKGNTTGWGVLSAEGVPGVFVGDLEWHDLGNGFTYCFLGADGYFRIGAIQRFDYAYGDSQWFHRGNGTSWAALTGTNHDPQFVGDGDWYTLNSQWSYRYDVTGDIGYFRDNVDGVNEERFSYRYADAAWYHRSSNSDWIWLCTTFSSISAQFVGDGGYHDMATGWWYSYDPEGHTAYWSKGQYTEWENYRFYYTYTIGLWQHKGYYGEYFHPLGSHGWWDPTFLGDGNGHWVNGGSNYKYHYDYDLDHGYWDDDPDPVDPYKYYYDVGKWFEWDWDNQVWGMFAGPKASTVEANPE